MKKLVYSTKKDTEEGKTGEPEPENGKNPSKAQEDSGTSREGAKKQ